MTLYIARHGETDYNRLRLMQGRRIDAALNAIGEGQARALADRFEFVHLNALYASPLLRARQTAECVALRHPGLLLGIHDDLAEMSWGTLEGRSIDEVGQELRAAAAEWAAGSFATRLGGGETILEVRDRANQVLTDLLARHEGQTVLAVTHGRYLRVFLAHAAHDADLTEMDRFPHSNTGVYRLDYVKGKWHVGLSNSTDHLTAVTA